MTVITLSRELGSQGDRIATLVAEQLGLGLVDRQRLRQAALNAGVSEAALHEFEMSEEGPWVSKILQSLRSVPPTPLEARESAGFVPPTSPLGGIFSPVLPPASIAIAELVRMLNQVIERRAQEGRVLFLGQGTEVLLRDHPGALHVRVVARRADRIACLQERDGLAKTAVLRRLRSSDRERAEYVRRFHNARWDDARNYHLVLNTSFLPLDAAAEVIAAASKAVSITSDR